MGHVETGITASLAALERITRYETLLLKSPWTAEERAFVEQYESFLFELQMVNFRESVKAGDSEANRKAFFGSDYPALLRAYEIENAVCNRCDQAIDPEDLVLERGDKPSEALCRSCNDGLNAGQALDHFADRVR